MADYKVTDTELTSIANAIRTKGGTQTQLEFPAGFISAVQAIPTGGGEPELPATYQEVEYIDFTPHAGFLVSVPTEAIFIVKAMFDSAPSSTTGETERDVLGYRESTNAQNDFEFGWFNSSNSIKLWIRDSDKGQSPEISSPAINTIYYFMAYFRDIRNTAYIGRYGINTVGAYSGMDGKIYRVMAISPSGTMLRNFVPCYRKSDNSVGFYELITGVFYDTVENIGGGSVAKGPDVT